MVLKQRAEPAKSEKRWSEDLSVARMASEGRLRGRAAHREAAECWECDRLVVKYVLVPKLLT